MRHSRRSREVNADINITAFMNLMVVLVPFLLITAVFSQLSILELNLPAPTDQNEPPPDEDKDPLVLEVLVYKDRYEVVDRQTGPLKVIPKKQDQYDYEGLRDFLERVKSRFPDITNITLLMEDDTPYEVLVQTMDTVRYTDQVVNAEVIKAELFPDIGIGSAPPDQSESGDAAGGAS